MTSPRKSDIFYKFVLFYFCIVCVNKLQISSGLENNSVPEWVPDGSVIVEEVRNSESEEVLDTGLERLGNYSRPWVTKCCNISYGYTFENKSCIETEDEFLPDFDDWPGYSETAKELPVHARYEYFIGDPCPEGKYILDVSAYSYDQYFIYSNGTLLYSDDLYEKEQYCLETVNHTVRVFICFRTIKNNPELNYMFILYAIGLLISIPFLLATAIVYLSVSMFRDLRGKSLSCHVLCLATGYLFLAIVQLGSDQLNEEFCTAAGFLIQFFFVAAFFWLNVISYDTWRCINNDFRCTYKPIPLRSEKITFWYYSLYGWYGPIVLSIASVVMDFEPAIPESYLKPNFGLQSCWFYSDDAALPYFYGPVGIVILVNIVFFILSARKIYSEQKKRAEKLKENKCSIDETRQKSLSIRIYTQTLQECVYLFCIMGINWAAEIISWALGGSQMIWLITDLFNALQGIMIFYLFVIRPISVRHEIKRQFREMWKKLIKCDCSYQEEKKRVSRHWHADISAELEEIELDKENDKFIGKTAAV